MWRRVGEPECRRAGASLRRHSDTPILRYDLFFIRLRCWRGRFGADRAAEDAVAVSDHDAGVLGAGLLDDGVVHVTDERAAGVVGARKGDQALAATVLREEQYRFGLAGAERRAEVVEHVEGDLVALIAAVENGEVRRAEKLRFLHCARGVDTQVARRAPAAGGQDEDADGFGCKGDKHTCLAGCIGVSEYRRAGAPIRRYAGTPTQFSLHAHAMAKIGFATAPVKSRVASQTISPMRWTPAP